MAQQLINIGVNANDGTGDSLRTAFGKINNNFSTLYSTTVTTGPQGSVQYRATINLSDLAYNGTQYVAIASPNRILVSTDATNWTPITNPTTKTPRAITVVGTTFVIVGDNGLIMTSTDGTTWTVITSTTTANLSSVAYDVTHDILIAVGSDSTIIRSDDSALTWTTITAPIACTLNAVTWAETLDLFVAVGETGVILTSVANDNTTGATVWYEAITPASIATTNLNAVSSYLNDVVVVGDAGKVLTSPNTILWTEQTSGLTDNLNGITVATLGGIVRAVAVGDGGKIITSAYDTTFSFNAWDATSYPSTTTVDLYSAKTVNSAVYAMGSTGTLFKVVGATWTDVSITVGIEGTAGFTFDPYLNLLSIDADIIPQTSNVWKLGNSTNRWESANFSANGITVGTVTLQQTPTLTIEFREGANLANLANITVDTATASNVFTDVLEANIANIDTANIGNLTSANASIGNLTVGDLTLTSLTITDLDIPGNISAANSVFTGTVTANYFIGNGNSLSNITGANVIGDVTSAITANFANYAGNITVAAQPNITSVGTLTSLTVANKVTAAYLQGDGSNITGLPVQSIVAGTNIMVSNVGGVWTITANDSNGISNPSAGPVKSIQYAGPNGTFDSSSALQFNEGTNELSLTGSITAFNFNGNVIGGNGAFLLLTADAVIADTFNGDLHGNVYGGNVTASKGTFTGNVTAGNITTGSISFDTQTSNEANIGNIHISRSNIHEFGAGNDNFVIDTERSNLVIQGANVATLNVDAPFVLIRGGNVAGSATGGNVTVESGSGGSAGKAGTLTLKGGAGGFGNDGGNIDILGGNGGLGGDGGSINIIAGVTEADTVTIKGANLYLQAGNTINEDAGTLVLQGGNAQGATLNGGNITITPGTGSQSDGYVYIANIQWPNDLGLNNQVLTTDGNGIAYWETVNGSIPGSVTVSNIVHGFSNVSINTHSGPVTVGIGGTANVATFTSSGLETTSVKTNHVILGNSSFTASDTWWVDAQTSTIAPLQVLFEMPAAGQNSVDFKVIAYDVPASNKQSSMITSVTYGINTNYSVYATTMINTMIASYTVDQSGGNIRLLASPSVNYLVRYTVIITKY